MKASKTFVALKKVIWVLHSWWRVSLQTSKCLITSFILSDSRTQKWAISLLSCGQTDGQHGRPITFRPRASSTVSDLRPSPRSAHPVSLAHFVTIPGGLQRTLLACLRKWIKYISRVCQQAVVSYKPLRAGCGQMERLDEQDTYLLSLHFVALGCPAILFNDRGWRNSPVAIML